MNPMVWFKAPEDASSVSRKGTYPVEDGVFGVDNPDDAEAFREQGYAETGAPAPRQEMPIEIPPRAELQEAPMAEVKALAERLKLEFKGNISRDALLDMIDTKRQAE